MSWAGSLACKSAFDDQFFPCHPHAFHDVLANSVYNQPHPSGQARRHHPKPARIRVREVPFLTHEAPRGLVQIM